MICFAIIFQLLISCKQNDQVGLTQVTGGKLGVTVTDTFKVYAHSIFEDSVKSNALGTNVAGSIADPVFGLTTGGFYTQYQLTTTDVSFGLNPQLDSLVLQLPYDGYYGDTNSTQTLNVYEMSSDLSSTISYYSYLNNSKNKQAQVIPAIIGTKTFKPHPTDSIWVNGVKRTGSAQICGASEN